MDTTNLNLSPRERAILEVLLERPGRPISRRQLRERLYGAREPEVLGNPVEVHIHNLRAKLGEGVIAPSGDWATSSFQSSLDRLRR